MKDIQKEICPENVNTSFQKERVFLLSICHFVHDIYSSFLAPLLPFVIVVGFTADHIGLERTYMLSGAVGLLGIPAILALPRNVVRPVDT